MSRKVSLDFTADVKADADERASFRCEVCRENAIHHHHHRKLKKHGGAGTLANCLAVCLRCHEFIHANPTFSYEKGWLLHSWDTPS